MPHWLEEAEREEQRKKERPSRESAKVQDKILNIRQNYDANKEIYENFIKYFFDLLERANNLPHEKKLPWVQIDFRMKESKLENHLYYAGTSEPIDKMVKTRSFPFFKRQHYKHVRSCHFNVSKKMDFAEIEIRDDYLAKTRLKSNDDETSDIYNDGFKRVKVMFEYEMNKLDKSLGVALLDWLAFKAGVNSLPFGEEHFKYDKRRYQKSHS
ncbi:MAG: hypothetical protein K9H16_15060 [Bacteroidales bacterium]|nr:hypothetical protein [Bacteroidales bacterium]